MRAGPEATFEDLDSNALLRVIRERTAKREISFAEPPVLLGQGGEARVHAFRLDTNADELTAPLILRRINAANDPEQVSLENAVHDGLRAQGFPAPRVLWADPDPSALGAPYLIAERLDGEVLLSEIERPDQLLARPTKLPRLIADALLRVPAQLAAIQTRLHRLDAHAFRRSLQDGGVDPSRISFAARLAEITDQVQRHSLDGLQPGIDWLHDHRPALASEVVCHGDLVFTNICVKDDEISGVFDWSTTVVADPAYDVAGSLIRLESNIPGVPALIGAVFRTVQRRLTRRYLRAYEREIPIASDRLAYFDAYWTLSELVWSSAHLRQGAAPTSAVTGRWLHPDTIDFGVGRFRARTGVELSPLRPS